MRSHTRVLRSAATPLVRQTHHDGRHGEHRADGGRVAVRRQDLAHGWPRPNHPWTTKTLDTGLIGY